MSPASAAADVRSPAPPARPGGVPRASGQVSRVLVWLFVATVAMKALVHLGVRDGILVGDESYYVDSARALSNAVRDLVWWRGPDVAELDAAVVGSGWFMPGMSIVLTPLHLVDPDASLAAVRTYLGVLSSALLALTALAVRRTWGDLPAGALLVFPGLVPTYAAFGMAGWGDSAAGLVLVLLACRAVDSVRTLRAGGSMSWRVGVVLGLYAIVAVYLRSSVAVAVLGMLGATFAVSMAVAASRERRRVVLGYAAAAVAFLALLAPWSVAASAALEAQVVTTVSVPTVRANAFGDRDRVCFGECDPGSNIWFSPLRYSREQAAATGLSEVDIADEMSAYARQEVTSTSYARDVAGNTARYLGEPARFATLLRWPDAPYNVVPLAEVLTIAMFYPMVLVGLVLLGAVARRSFDHQLRLVLLKIGILALLAQPFVHAAGPRYWTTMAPLLGLGAALLWSMRQERRAGAAGSDAADGSAWLHRAQVGLSSFAAAVVLVLAVLAI